MRIIEVHSIGIHSKGIGIDPLVPLIRSLSEEVGDQVVSPSALFVNNKKNFGRCRPLDPSIYLEIIPGI